MASRRELRRIETMVASSGGGEERGGRNASEREKTKLRERKRRAITTKIFNGLRKHGGYQLPPRADINDVLGELAREAGWVVEPDGTTYPSHHREPSNPGRVVHLLQQCPACGYSVPARTASLRRTPPAVSAAETALPPPLHATCPWSSSSSSSPPAMPFLLGSNLAGSQAETVASPSLPISAGNSAAAFTWNGGGCKLCGVGGEGRAGSRRRGEGGERDEDDDADAAGEGIQSQHSNWVLLSGGCLMDGDIGELPQSAF